MNLNEVNNGSSDGDEANDHKDEEADAVKELFYDPCFGKSK